MPTKSVLRITPIVVLLLMLAVNLVSAADLSTTVAAFYPTSLDTKVNGRFVSRTICFAVVAETVDGLPRIVVAGYSNGVAGAVRSLVADSQEQFAVSSDVSGFSFAGNACRARALDFDGDGAKEVLLSFRTPRGNTIDWVFRVVGDQLVNVSPTVSVGSATFSSLMDVGIVDLHHDGTLQILDTAGYPPAVDGSPRKDADTLYRFQGGALASRRWLGVSICRSDALAGYA